MSERGKEILSTSVYILCVLLVSLFIIKYIGQRTEVIGDSMNPTLYDKENLILNKVSYRFHDPERFDIVVFPFRNGENKNYIKRIIALPGETIYIDKKGNIYIDDVLLEEHYGKEVIRSAGRAKEPITLGEDEYFVMGDNRNNSEDSRFYEVQNVKRSEILGKVWIRIYPFSKFGKVDK